MEVIHSPEQSEDSQLNIIAGKVANDYYLEEKFRQQNSYDHQKAFRRLLQLNRRFRIRRLYRIVAAIFLPLAIGLFVYLEIRSPQPQPVTNYTCWTDIQPGKRLAFLKLHNGQEMQLSNESAKLQEINGMQINVDSSGLHYDGNRQAEDTDLIYNTLIVPRGGEYFLTFSDGTKVWLNADTKLKYPVTFGKHSREVTIKGEAYFAVAKAENCPFIVKTDLGSVKVLGTEFNIRNYTNNDKLTATLVKGKISFTLPRGEEIILKPNQQLIAEKGKTTEVREIDTRFCTGWKDGLFQFREERLEDIMEQLSRWYDIGVFYTCEPVKNLHFSGDLSRFKSINTFIEMFEKSSDLKFTLHGKTLIIGL